VFRIRVINQILFQINAERPTLFCPISNKNVGISCTSVVSVATENQFFTIGTKHGEGIKAIIMTYLFQTGTITIDRI
jgi:hypothetical protein